MEGAPEPWRPGMALTDSTRLVDICAAVAFGQSKEGYNQVGQALASRNCLTIRDWREYTVCELYSLMKTLDDLKSKRHYFLAGLQAVTQIKLKSDDVKAEGMGKSGGDTTSGCRKVEPGPDFNPAAYVPDGLVYEGVPRAEIMPCMEDGHDKLYLDKLWLELQAAKEPSLGDYVPAGMVTYFSKIHRKLKLADFKPAHAGKAGKEKARKVEDVIANKIFNGRNYPCKRIVLSGEFRSIFSLKTQSHLTFKPAGDSALGPNNERNAAMAMFVAVRENTRVRQPLVFPRPDGPRMLTRGMSAHHPLTSQLPRSPHRRPTASRRDASHRPLGLRRSARTPRACWMASPSLLVVARRRRCRQCR